MEIEINKARPPSQPGFPILGMQLTKAIGAGDVIVTQAK
jgi:hypothetical protein